MDAAEIMTRDVVTVTAANTVREAFELLEDQHIRHLPVVVEGRLVGMISDRDLREYRLPLPEEMDDPAHAATLLSTPLAEVMQGDPIALGHGDSVGEAIDLMLTHGISAVPVVDRHEDRLLGIVSYVDILQAVRAKV